MSLIYRVEISAYNTRATFKPMWFVYEVRGWNRADALRRLPHSHRPPKNHGFPEYEATCRHAQPCFQSHKTLPHYPEWTLVSMRTKRGKRGVSQTRQPLPWTHDKGYHLVECGQYQEKKEGDDARQ